MSRSSAKTSRGPRRHSLGAIIATWAVGIASLGLLYVVGSALGADLGSFRSCNANSSGLSVSSCGKQSLNPGDLVVVTLFFLCTCLAIALFTAAWRMTRRAA